MAFGFVSIVHIVAAVLSIIELGLTGYAASKFNGLFGDSSPSSVNFMIFNSIWSLLVLLYVGITPLRFEHLFHKLVSLGLEGVTTLFWFAGSIALAARVGPVDCGTNSLCGTLKASIAFGFFLFFIFAALAGIDAFESIRRRPAGTADGSHHMYGHNKPTVQPYAGA